MRNYSRNPFSSSGSSSGFSGNPAGRPSTWKIIVAAIVVVVLAGLFLGSCKSVNRTGPTEVALIRNGGWLDDKTIRTVRPPESQFTVSGLFSEVRKYISNKEQRFYTITTDPNRADNPSATFVEVPTKDGVQVRIEATTLFNTSFTGEDQDPLLREFDQRFGNRKFKDSGSGKELYVWEGNDGFSAFLDTIFRPVLVSTIREEIGGLKCADLVSSCALINQDTSKASTSVSGQDNQDSFQKVADEVQTKLQKRVEDALDGLYLENFSFQIARVELPGNVQTAINEAQSAFASIAQQRANSEAAKFEAQRARQLAKQYRNAPSLAQIEIAKILKDSNATVIMGGGDYGFNLKGK
jgi:hypothetical protein